MSLKRDLEITQAAFLAAENQYARQIARAYRDALTSIRAELSRIYEKYAVKGVLTKAEMTRYNRLTGLEEALTKEISAATNKSIGVINRLKPDQYGEGYFRAAWMVDNATGVALKWGALNKAAITANLMNPSYENAIKSIRGDAIGKMRIAIEQGLTLGKSYATMLTDLKNVINLEAYKALRIMRTELHTAQEAGNVLAYMGAIDQGVDGKIVWTATLDDVTRHTHQTMDGQPVADDGFFNGPGSERARFPGDPDLSAGERINCRCSTRMEITGLSPVLRRSREDGVIPYQTYGQWRNDRKLFK